MWNPRLSWISWGAQKHKFHFRAKDLDSVYSLSLASGSPDSGMWSPGTCSSSSHLSIIEPSSKEPLSSSMIFTQKHLEAEGWGQGTGKTIWGDVANAQVGSALLLNILFNEYEWPGNQYRRWCGKSVNDERGLWTKMSETCQSLPAQGSTHSYLHGGWEWFYGGKGCDFKGSRLKLGGYIDAGWRKLRWRQSYKLEIVAGYIILWPHCL